MPKPVIRYQAQLLFRRSYKPGRTVVLRLRPRATLTVRHRAPVHNPACAPEGAWSLTQSE